jgi:hypothetical protein
VVKAHKWLSDFDQHLNTICNNTGVSIILHLSTLVKPTNVSQQTPPSCLEHALTIKVVSSLYIVTKEKGYLQHRFQADP